MQINGPSFLPSPIRPAQRPNQTAFTAPRPEVPQAVPNGGTPAMGGPSQQPIDVATILQNWGTSNPLADLNTDGIVDAADLALASESQNSGANGVLANWGSGGASDLNGDGAVDAQDLAAALSGAQETANAGGSAAAWQSTAGGDHNGDGTIDAQDLAMALTGTQNAGGSAAAWQSAAGGDHNGDGAVDGQDLAISLSGQQGAAGSVNPGEPVETKPIQLVQSLVDRAFATRDADQDGQLVAGDFRSGTKIFERLDLDQSGGIGREELTKALLADFGRFREQFPGAAPTAFARRWADAFAGTHPVPNPAGAAQAAKAFANPAAFALNATRGVLSALA